MIPYVNKNIPKKKKCAVIYDTFRIQNVKANKVKKR